MSYFKTFKGVTERIALLSVSCIFSILLLEIIVRVFNLAPQVITDIGPFRFADNPEIVYEFIPGSYIDGSIINKQGFKDSDFVTEKPKNVVRIAMLGDSITQGMNVPLGKTFSDQLEKMLNLKAAEIKSKTRYEVMNFGVGGYNLGAEVETLKTKVIKYSPDIVVLNFFHNDNEPLPGIQLFFQDCTIIDNQEKEFLYKKYYSGRNSIWRNFQRNILYKTKFYPFLVWRINNLSTNKFKFLAYTKKYHNSFVDNKKDNVFYAHLSEIAALKERNGFKFLICIHPHLLTGQHPNNKKFAEAAKEFNFPYFNMYEYYKKEQIPAGSIQILKEDTCHPNELGHIIVARAIFSELKKNGFIDQRLQ
jgi:lysophospholipase L1-like esterase